MGRQEGCRSPKTSFIVKFVARKCQNGNLSEEIKRIWIPRSLGGFGEDSGPVRTHFWPTPARQRPRNGLKSNFYPPAGQFPIFTAIFEICPSCATDGPLWCANRTRVCANSKVCERLTVVSSLPHRQVAANSRKVITPLSSWSAASKKSSISI